ncbi:MAG: hypothetical protein JXM68_07470 [Sedimentisphaerales bacterium]|nr:hypothetical protein [Sedimentisphaerales bacterium]
MASSLAAQDNTEAQAAQKLVLDKYAYLLNDFVLKGAIMDEQEVKAFAEDVIKSRDIRRYRQDFPGEVKLKLAMAVAVVDFYEGKGLPAVKSALRAANADPKDAELKSCYIYLAYMAKDYDGLKKALGKDAGSAVIEAYKLSTEKLMAKVNADLAVVASRVAAGKTTAVTNDPNSPTVTDPNTPGFRPARREPVADTTPNRGRFDDVSSRGLSDPRMGRDVALGTPVVADVAIPELRLDETAMPLDMLGVVLDKFTLESVNGSYVSYDPSKGKVLCLLLWGYQDQGVYSQAKALTEKFKRTAGGFGPVQYIALNCNEINDMIAAKHVFNDLMNHPAFWPQCLMSPGNKSQLAKIVPASAVLLIAGRQGEVRYVGPADSFLADAIIQQEIGSEASVFAADKVLDNIVPVIDIESVGQALEQAVKAGVTVQDNAALPVSAEKTPAAEPVDDIDSDPTLITARKKLDVARTKLKVPVGISYKSALDLCDEVLEGWPDTQVAQEAKEIIDEICSKHAGQVFKKQRINEGKYAGKDAQ